MEIWVGWALGSQPLGLLDANLAARRRQYCEDIERIPGAIDRTRSWVMVRTLKLDLAGEGEVLSLLRAREQNAADGGRDAHDVMKELTAIVRGTNAA